MKERKANRNYESRTNRKGADCLGKYFGTLWIAAAFFLLTGCGTGKTEQQEETDAFPISVMDAALLFEEEICSNEAYVEAEEDKVYLKVQVYQKQDNQIVVNASSNTAFFDGLQYTVEAGGELSASDIEVEWMTFMGSMEDSEDNQKCVAHVKICEDGEIISERKINYFTKGIEMVVDTVETNLK